MISRSDYKHCLQYIDKQWEKLTFNQRHDFKTFIGLPHRTISRNDSKFNKEQFYWDSYFIILGLMQSNKYNIAQGMLENLISLYKKYGLIPARNRLFSLSLSQPPFLTSIILEIYQHNPKKAWLKTMATIATMELKEYWDADLHQVYQGLSRYTDVMEVHAMAEHESGWDMTSRFRDHCADRLAIDLNACLYKYETDLAEIYNILGDNKQKNYFSKQAKTRQKTVTDLMWDKKTGFFYDYDFKNKRRGKFMSLAGFFPMWSKMATTDQAKALVKNLKKFEQAGGLSTTQATGLLKPVRQWDHPNGYAPLHWIVIKGLLNYGYKTEAETITKKWLDCNTKVFDKTGQFWEKYNVVRPNVGQDGRYPTEANFAWTMAVYVKLVKKFGKK